MPQPMNRRRVLKLGALGAGAVMTRSLPAFASAPIGPNASMVG